MKNNQKIILYQLSRNWIENYYSWTGTFKISLEEAKKYLLNDNSDYFYTTDFSVLQEMNMKPIN